MTHVEQLVQDPDEIAKRVAEHLHRISREATSQDLVYTPFSNESYYRDLIVAREGRIGIGDARQRLHRHAEQMDVLHETREKQAWTRLRASGLEYRVTPNRTPGTGGYFSPPAWLNELFATANRPGRVLAGLMPRFALPLGVSSVNVPIIGTGTAVQTAIDDTAVVDQGITDSAGSSQVVPFGGQADVALQLLEQSPQGAHLDWAIFMDLNEAYDFDLETQLLSGPGGQSLLGVTSVQGINNVTYTDTSPTGSAMWPYLSRVPAAIGKTRRLPPECWMMTTSRWCSYQGSEDAGERPFGLSPIFIGKDDDSTPDPIGGIMGWPVFLDDAIPTNLGSNGEQDLILCLRPRDLLLLEGTPQTLVAREPLSGALGVRLQMHCNVAALTDRRPAGIGVLEGTGMTVQAGY